VLVRSYMTRKPVTIRPESDFLAAVAILKAGHFSSLPVVTAEGKLVGILTDRDVAAASPPSIDILEPRRPDYYGVHLRVEQVMNPDFVSIGPDVPLEEAALVMLERHVDRLLIVEDGQLIGIITSSDIFRQLVTILGGGSSAIRLTVEVPNVPGQLAQLAGAIASVGGNIVSVATAGKTEERVALTLRIEKADWQALRPALAERCRATVVHVCGPDVAESSETQE
jgi:acetoin utilization protein AcuB